MIQELRITGVYVQYYRICRRKLWWFARNIKMEEQSDLVYQGKLIDERTFEREKKHINIDDTINIDFVDKEGVINEVKKSSSMEDADEYQVKYYLYYLKQRGVSNLKGMIHYPRMKQKREVELTEKDVTEIEQIIEEIETLLEQSVPPPVLNAKLCKKCSYYELCYI